VGGLLFPLIDGTVFLVNFLHGSWVGGQIFG
jgi:hypothetical protein